jgi:hypothetical protein
LKYICSERGLSSTRFFFLSSLEISCNVPDGAALGKDVTGGSDEANDTNMDGEEEDTCNACVGPEDTYSKGPAKSFPLGIRDNVGNRLSSLEGA